MINKKEKYKTNCFQGIPFIMKMFDFLLDSMRTIKTIFIHPPKSLPSGYIHVELEHILKIINNAQTLTHLTVAEKMFNNFIYRWNLGEEHTKNPFCSSVYRKIAERHNELIADDKENARNISDPRVRVKRLILCNDTFRKIA